MLMCPRDHVLFRFSMILNYILFLLRRFTNEFVKRRSEKALLQQPVISTYYEANNIGRINAIKRMAYTTSLWFAAPVTEAVTLTVSLVFLAWKSQS